MKLHPRNRRASERGSILIWLALFLIVTIAFISLGIDIAKLMATRTQLQNAADAGALAGASAINYSTGYIDEAIAPARAAAVATKNKAFIGTLEPLISADVTVSCVPLGEANRCSVYVTRTGGRAVITTLAQVVGVKTLNMDASATARLDQPTCVKGVAPLGVGNSDPDFKYDKGQEYALVKGIGTGNYQYLNFGNLEEDCPEGPCGGNKGAKELNCELKYGYGCCLKVGEIVDVKTGEDVGQVKDAINDYRFANDTWQLEYSSEWTDAYEDYQSHKGNGLRVVIVPIVKFSTDPGGTKMALINGFASFFLKRKIMKVEGEWSYYGEFIQTVDVGEGSGGEGTVHTIRLVK